MANLTVQPAKIVLKSGESECGILINDPGRILGVDFHLSRRLVTGAGGGPEFDEDLVIYIELDPARPVRRRHFLVIELTEGRKMPDDVTWTFLGKAQSASGKIVFVYELHKDEAKSKLVRASC